MTLATTTQTREQWLESAVIALRPLLREVDAEPPAVRVSCGRPSTRATSAKRY